METPGQFSVGDGPGREGGKRFETIDESLFETNHTPQALDANSLIDFGTRALSVGFLGGLKRSARR